MKNLKTSLIWYLVAGGLYSMGAAAQDQPASMSGPGPATENGITYMSGGVGDEEAKALQRAAKDYDLMLTFTSQKHGAYLSDVKVDIEDTKGNTVLSTVSDGPIFLADMPPGNYRVTAETEGKAYTQNVKVPNSGRHHTVSKQLTWPNKLVESPAPEPEPAMAPAPLDSRAAPAPLDSRAAAAPLDLRAAPAPLDSRAAPAPVDSREAAPLDPRAAAPLDPREAAPSDAREAAPDLPEATHAPAEK